YKIYFTLTQEAADLLDMLLKDRERARRIKEAGREKVLKQHNPRLLMTSY
ncbi:glycosyltransferase, partial [Bacillus vallismortis]|nr:glycosyltransferase [Bacillus vallismortis]